RDRVPGQPPRPDQGHAVGHRHRRRPGQLDEVSVTADRPDDVHVRGQDPAAFGPGPPDPVDHLSLRERVDVHRAYRHPAVCHAGQATCPCWFGYGVWDLVGVPQNFRQSAELQERLHRVVPGGAHTYARGADQYPEGITPVLVRGKGARVWDVDGNNYVEYGM